MNEGQNEPTTANRDHQPPREPSLSVFTVIIVLAAGSRSLSWFNSLLTFQEQVLQRARLGPKILLGTRTRPPSSAAACQGQRGSYRIARASAIRSASPVPTIASACSKSLISPTA